MSQVNVTINGRQFRMACEDGQEDHLMKLAKDLDERIEGLRKNFGEIGDNRLIVMAALTVVDQLDETTAKLRAAEADLASVQNANVTAADHSRVNQAAVVTAFNSAAERLEGIAKKLNQTVADGKIALG